MTELQNHTETAPALLAERSGDVLHLTLNRPEAYNAIDADLRDSLISALDSAEGEGVRAILLSGAGRGFCSGIDLKKLATSGPGLPTTQAMRASTQRMVRSLLECPVPVVSAVHGVVAGIGLTLAVGADVCIAATSATFVPAFAERAIVPDGGLAFLLPRLMGMARTKDFLMRGKRLAAPEAASIGMIAEAVDDSQLLQRAGEEAETLATMPTATLSLLKQMLSQSFGAELEATLLIERAAQGLSSATQDAREGREAFFERRTPRFTGA